MKFFLFLSLLVPALTVLAQEKDPNVMLEFVKNRYQKVNDYKANAEIIVSVDFIKIPEKYAIVFYKSPDKFRFKSAGFIMVPKKGINFSILEIINHPYTAVYDGVTEINGKNDYEIKVIPLDHKSDLVLATVWIDPLSFFIDKVEANTRRSGTYLIDFEYDQNSMPLPDEMRITFEVAKLRFPLKFMGNVQVDEREGQVADQATVIIKYSGYQVNTGLKDDIFIENDK